MRRATIQINDFYVTTIGGVVCDDVVRADYGPKGLSRAAEVSFQDGDIRGDTVCLASLGKDVAASVSHAFVADVPADKNVKIVF